MSSKPILLIAFVLSAICAFAQQDNAAAAKAANVLGTATRTCFATFNTALPNFCVTQNGNITNFVYPKGYSQIFTDGYGLCDITSGSNNRVSYYDDGDQDSGNWQASVITEPNGPNTFPLTINRTTLDGFWTVKQVFSRNTSDAYVKVVITWHNNTTVTRSLYTTRYVDIDADGQTINYFDGTIDSGWGYNKQIYPHHGLTIRSNTSPNNHFGYSVQYSGSLGGNHDPCWFTSNITTGPSYGDNAVRYYWIPGKASIEKAYKVPAHGQFVQTLEFRPM